MGQSNSCCGCNGENNKFGAHPDTLPNRSNTEGKHSNDESRITTHLTLVPSDEDTKLMETNSKQIIINTSDKCDQQNDTYEPSMSSILMDPNDDESSPESSTEPSLASTKENKERAISAFKNAINKGNEELALYHIEQNPNMDLISTPFENDDNCLQIAIKNQSHKLVYFLLMQGISVKLIMINISIIYTLCKFIVNIKVILKLIVNGLSYAYKQANAQNPNNGETALHTAVRSRDIKMVALLSKYAADPTIRNRNLETPITIAMENNDYDILEIIAPETQKDSNINDRSPPIEAGHVRRFTFMASTSKSRSKPEPDTPRAKTTFVGGEFSTESIMC